MNSVKFFAILFAVVSAMAFIVACPKGTSVTTSGSVAVDPAHCIEDILAAAPAEAGAPKSITVSDNVNLSCATASGSVTVTFPRKAWQTIVTTPPAADAGPSGLNVGPGK